MPFTRFALLVLFMLSALGLCRAEALASDRQKARYYLELADNAWSDANAYGMENNDDLMMTSANVAIHFADQAGQYFNGEECGPDVKLWWFSYMWIDFSMSRSSDDRKLISDEIRGGRYLLHRWQTHGWDKTYPGVFQGAVVQFHDVQRLASEHGVDPTTGAIVKQKAQKKNVSLLKRPKKCPPNEDASVVTAETPEYPESAKGLGELTVLVRVDLDERGIPVDTSILQSSNNDAVDRAALSAARRSTYKPKISGCRAVRSTVTNRATFDPNS